MDGLQGKKNVKNKVIPWINDRVVDKGAGYEKDDFIDDSEDVSSF